MIKALFYLWFLSLPVQKNQVYPNSTQIPSLEDNTEHYYIYNRNIPKRTIELNVESIKDVSCTFIKCQVNLNEKNKFKVTTKILYLWEL